MAIYEFHKALRNAVRMSLMSKEAERAVREKFSQDANSLRVIANLLEEGDTGLAARYLKSMSGLAKMLDFIAENGENLYAPVIEAIADAAEIVLQEGEWVVGSDRNEEAVILASILMATGGGTVMEQISGDVRHELGKRR